MTARLRTAVIGCGLIAQVAHFHYLEELDDRFEVSALCDVSPGALAHAHTLFPDASTHIDWRELLDSAPLDAVMILTPGSHAPIAIAALERDIATFIEKPLAFSSREAADVVAAQERSGAVVMVGYMKRYDPAYQRIAALIGSRSDLRLVCVTTLESPIGPYVAHYPLHRPDDIAPELRNELEADDRTRVRLAIGAAADDETAYWAYRVVLLDCLVHEFNVLRGLLGEPTELGFASASQDSATLTAALKFGCTQCVLTWVDLPELAHYSQDFSMFWPERRLELHFPSPFLRNARASVRIEVAGSDPISALETIERLSPEDSFKRELIEFHDCVATERQPITDARDGARDLALCEAFVRAALDGVPQPAPTEPLVSVQQ
jgi:predicted dehydrogenase